MTPQRQGVRSTDCSRAEPSLRLRFDRFEIDEADARLTKAGEPIALRPTPFAVLCALARAPRTLVTKDTLLDTVWGERVVTESVLKASISEVRRVLGDDSKHPRYIETVSRRGYRFIAPLDAPEAQSDGASPAPQPASSWTVGRSQELQRLRDATRRGIGEGKYRPQLLVLEGRIADELGKRDRANKFLRQAVVEACGREAPWLELIALSALCERGGGSAEERAALRHAVDQITRGAGRASSQLRRRSRSDPARR